MIEEKVVPYRFVKPGDNISQGRGGQAIIQDVVGNIFFTTQNTTRSNLQTLSVQDSISSISILNGEPSLTIETRSPFSSNNFNTIDFDQTPIKITQTIQPVYKSSNSSLEIVQDILPTPSAVVAQQTVKTKNTIEDELEFLPDVEDIIYSPLYDSDIIGLEAESFSFLDQNISSLSIPTSDESKTIQTLPTITSNNKETEDIIKSILQGLDIPVNIYTITFIKAWRQAEGGNATWNLLNSSKPFKGSTRFNKFNVQNYKSKEAGIEANILTLKLPRYSKIINGLKKIKSLNDGYDLAVQLSDGPSNGPFYVWSLGYYDRIQTLCARGNKNYICPAPLSIKNEYVARVLKTWIKNNNIRFTNFIKKTK